MIVNTQAGFDAHSHILTHFNVFWSFGVLVSDGWANETEREDIREHAQEAIISINQGISVLNSNPSSAQVIAVVRALLIIVRKLIRYIAG